MINRANHELFRLHYGDFEYQRLRPIFETEPEELTTGAEWSVPPIIEASYKIRLVCMAGVGSMSFLQKLLSNQPICQQIKCFIFVENDPKVISHLINHRHFAAFIEHLNIKICFDVSEESIKPNLFSILKQPNFSEIMELACVYFNQTEADETRKNFYSHIDSYLKETVEHVYNNYGRIDDSLDGVRATFMNGNRIFDCPGIEDLRNFYQGKPAVICGAGPSLDLAIPYLKANEGKFLLLAADAAVKPLRAAGLKPHFCTSIERLNKFQEPFWRDLEPSGCQLVCFPVVHPDVLDLYKDPIRIVYRNYSYYAYFQKSWPKGILHCGGSTTNLAIRLADYMGCSQIILAGVDHSYEKNEETGLYRSHCFNTGDPKWSEWHPLEYFSKPEGRNHAPAFPRPSNNGQDVFTNYTYYLWSKEFAEEIRAIGKPIIDTALNGVSMDGVTYKPIDEVLGNLPSLGMAKAPINKTHFYRKWDHKMLRSSIEGWIRISNNCLELLSQPLDEKNFRYIGDIYNLKFVREDLFISFVLQNCAVEYFKLQNEFNGLDQNEGSLPAHISIMKRRFELFLRLLHPLADIIDRFGSLDYEKQGVARA